MYVDDLHILRLSLSLIFKLKAQLASKFKTTNLDLTPHYLGIEISWKNDVSTVTQTIYIDQLLNTYQIRNCNPESAPIVERLRLASVYDDFSPGPKYDSDYKPFTRIVQWLACQTWPDIIQTVSRLSQDKMKATD